jgi:hypothetical protein
MGVGRKRLVMDDNAELNRKKVELLDDLLWRFEEWQKCPRAERPITSEDWVDDIRYMLDEVKKVK